MSRIYAMCACLSSNPFYGQIVSYGMSVDVCVCVCVRMHAWVYVGSLAIEGNDQMGVGYKE